MDGIPEFLRPGESYMVPNSSLFFGHMHEVPGLLAFLPQPSTTRDKLIRRYFEAVHPIARCVHRPSFEQLYASFEADIQLLQEPKASMQAVVFAAWFSAAVSMGEWDIEHEYGCKKIDLVTKLKAGVEQALAKANFLRTTKFETMQALVMYMVSRSHGHRTIRADQQCRFLSVGKKCHGHTPSSSARPFAWLSAWVSTVTLKPTVSVPLRRTCGALFGTSSASWTSGPARLRGQNPPSVERITTQPCR